MALINCPECGKQVSDRAASCIHCGFPLDEYVLEQAKKLETQDAVVEVIEENKNISMRDDVCPRCGNDINKTWMICMKCGWRKRDEDILGEGTKQSQPIVYKPVDKPAVVEKEVVVQEEAQIQVPQKEVPVFDGIYKYTMFGKIRVYCPRCKSSNCSHYKEQHIKPGKTKTTYSVNLNPLKPFTVLNKKEKVVKKDSVVTENKIICNDCGKIFY